MSWVIGTVTLPINPTKIMMRYPTVSSEATNPGDYAILLSIAKKAITLTLEGILYKAGYSAADLETNYINPLVALLHNEVTISAPDTRYDGDWIFNDFKYEERGGLLAAFNFTMIFKRGGIHIVL